MALRSHLPVLRGFLLPLLTLSLAQAVHGQAVFAEAHMPARQPAISSSVADGSVEEGAGASSAILATRRPMHTSFLHGLGFSVHTGVNGAGADVAMPLTQRTNLRVGADYFRYGTSFTQEGANVDASLRLGHGRVALDWFPFGNGFRVSPQAIVGILTRVDATVLVPPGQTISLDGRDFVSSSSDPLRGSAAVSTRRYAPGLTVGWGNIAPRGERHLTFPVEVGFYYIGQPNLAVNFQGSACDPTVPQPLGCQSVSSDPQFQSSLSAFIRRNQNNLSYASFFPVASVGVGYRF